MSAAGRRSRLFQRGEDDPDDRGADLSDDEHAWWAAREEVAGVPRGIQPEDDPPPPAPDSAFSDYWTTESLFEPQPPPPPPSPRDEPLGSDVDLPEGMDLDSAHLVLQVEVGVEWNEVTRSHRRLVKQYHPDRLIGYSPDAQELGRTRMAEINEAHATLRALYFH